MGLPDVLRKHGISAGTFYRWRAKFGGMDMNAAGRLKVLENENRRFMRLVADQAASRRWSGLARHRAASHRLGWARQDSNLQPRDYESPALTN